MGGLIGGIIGAFSANKAGNEAASAANAAAQVDAQRYQQTRTDLAPFTAAGASVLPDLTSLAQSGPNGPGGTNYLAPLANLQPPTMTQADLEQTPGYQFTRQQGLLATQSSAAARGLGVSGAALKGAATYATGLADSTYKDQFNIAQQQYMDKYNLGIGLNTAQQGNITNQYNRLSGVASIGEGAGAQTGLIGANLAQSQGNALTAAGQAQAAGTIGVGNAITGGLNSANQNLLLAAQSGATGGLGA